MPKRPATRTSRQPARKRTKQAASNKAESSRKTDSISEYRTGLSDRLRRLQGDESTHGFARRLRLTVSAWQSWTNGREPKPSTLLQIAEATGCDATWLVTGQGTPYPEPLRATNTGSRAADEIVRAAQETMRAAAKTLVAAIPVCSAAALDEIEAVADITAGVEKAARERRRRLAVGKKH